MKRLALVLLLASCTTPPAVPPVAPVVKLPNTEWLLTSMRGKPLIEGTRITLQFDEKGAGGYSGCNWYGGDYTLSGSKLTFGLVSATARGCMQRGVGRQESDYHAILRNLGDFKVDDDRLVMHDPSGNPVLEFTRIKALPMDPAKLVGTRWRLPGSPVTLELTADAMSGFAGCRDYTGTYVAKGDKIKFTSISMSSTDCAKSRKTLVAEENYTTDLSETERYSLSADRLEFTTASGRKLVFVPYEGPPPAITGAPQLMPVDEAAKDPSFARFRADLIEALQREDKKALLAVIADHIKVDFGGGEDRAAFIRHWELDGTGAGSPVWSELQRILRLGGTFGAENQFWAPYVFSKWPESIDAFEHVAAVGPRVFVRDAPDDNAKPIATLDHHIVRIAQGDPMRGGNQSAAMRKVVLPDGREGWVAEDEVRSPIDYRAAFEKRDGKWKMTLLVAGD